eukprot:6008631-Amphidinium_carterae.4
MRPLLQILAGCTWIIARNHIMTQNCSVIQSFVANTVAQTWDFEIRVSNHLLSGCKHRQHDVGVCCGGLASFRERV